MECPYKAADAGGFQQRLRIPPAAAGAMTSGVTFQFLRTKLPQYLLPWRAAARTRPLLSSASAAGLSPGASAGAWACCPGARTRAFLFGEACLTRARARAAPSSRDRARRIIGAAAGTHGYIFSSWYWAGGVHAICILIAGIVSAASGFSSVCCLTKCKTCTVVGSYVAAALALLGVILLAIPYSFCHSTGCLTYDWSCTEIAPHWVDPDVDSSVPNGLICYNQGWPGNCGNRYCTWLDEDCDEGPSYSCGDDCAYWSFTTEDDCMVYANSFVGWLPGVAITCVVVGFFLIFVTALGTAITGSMAPSAKEFDAGGAAPPIAQVQQPGPVVGAVVIQQPELVGKP